jgi:hypothetical protein
VLISFKDSYPVSETSNSSVVELIYPVPPPPDGGSVQIPSLLRNKFVYPFSGAGTKPTTPEDILVAPTND